jgi:hypothetical protein
MIPAEDEVHQQDPGKQTSRYEGDNEGMVKEEHECGNAKTKTEVDKLADRFSHDGSSPGKIP